EDATSTGTGPTYESAGCVSGGCYLFDGGDDYVNLPSATDVQKPISINAWFYSTSNGGYIFAADPGPRLFLISNLQLEADVEINNAWQPWVVDTAPITDNAWNMITYVINGAIQSLYVNGKFISSGEYRFRDGYL
ncbi:MAG: LamG domain-containing protein, partial [Patescibacteria group bacterium]|nr:LamG domain-containing protein [Patescibacteria group bacterium]